MTTQPFRVEHIDHVELYVPDQYEAANWYARLLGLQILPDYESWAADGPLMISSDDGRTMLALFRGDPPGFRAPTGFRRVAFRVDGAGFRTFRRQVAAHGVYNHAGQLVHGLEVVDHEKSYSVYFCDPYGNRYEVTTYEYQTVAVQLQNEAG